MYVYNVANVAVSHPVEEEGPESEDEEEEDDDDDVRSLLILLDRGGTKPFIFDTFSKP